VAGGEDVSWVALGSGLDTASDGAVGPGDAPGVRDTGVGGPVADAPTHAARAISASSRAAAGASRDVVPVKGVSSCTGASSPARGSYGPLDGRTQTSP
jgi:hypothetical protein